MKSPRAKNPRSTNSAHRLAAMIVLACLISGDVVWAWLSTTLYADTIVPGLFLADKPIGGKSKEYTQDMLREYSDHLHTKGVVFSYGKKTVTLYPTPISLSSDIPTSIEKPLFDIDSEQSIHAVTSFGRTGTLLERERDRLRALMKAVHIAPRVLVDRDRLIESLKKEFSFFHSPAQNARFALDAHGALIVTRESSGLEFDYDRAVQDLVAQLETFSSPRVLLTQKIAYPTITRDDLTQTKSSATQILARAPFTLNDAAQTQEQSEQDHHPLQWTLSKTTLVNWLVPVRASDGAIHIELEKQAARDYLDHTVAPDVFVAAHAPRFEMKDGRVTAFEHAQTGKRFDTDRTITLIEQSFIRDNSSTALNVVVQDVSSPYADTPENDLHITDLLFHAQTSFAGSPQNRKKNIARGASLINGIVLAPHEEFSLIKALGKISQENGFLPELVIKGDKTTPEFGGGLCQVSTTLFRAVAYAGLEVRQRRNHSYRVSYYEPPVGFDATIYDPSPDFRFKNDTDNYLLIQSSIKGNSMVVELWGTRDGRKVEVDKPTVFNIKKAGETKIIETPDLPPGEKKCTEHAHNGADAIFERRIFYANGSTKKETYKSHYVVWPAVCLVGKKPDVPSPGDPSQASGAQSPTGPTKPELSDPLIKEEAPPADTINGAAP